jgi:hypothetical protein
MFDHQATKDQVTPATNAKGRENDATSEDEHARDIERHSAIRRVYKTIDTSSSLKFEI